MQLDFLVEEEWSMTLVRRVHRAYRLSGNSDSHVFYRGLHWRIVSSREVRGQIFGVRIKTVPRVLRPYDYEMFLYDFLVSSRLKAGIYTHETARSAEAELRLQTGPEGKPLYKLKITGKSLRDVNALYELIVQRAIDPYME